MGITARRDKLSFLFGSFGQECFIMV
jgi:hypothetical protein